jgi:hypothetical protein
MFLKSAADILLKFSKREKAVFFITAFFVSLTFIDRLIIAPISLKIRSIDNGIVDSELAVRKNLRLLKYKDRILAERKKYESFLSYVLDPEGEVTAILKEIENLASKSSVYLVELKPSSVKNESKSELHMFTLSCEAQIEQLIDFMYGIEGSSRLLSIEKYQISPKTKDSSLVKCNMTISCLLWTMPSQGQDIGEKPEKEINR